MRKLTILLSQLLLSALLVSQCAARSNYHSSDHHFHNAFIQCLETHSDPSNPISAVLYTTENSSYSSVLQGRMWNIRFNESTTPKPELIITATHVSHIQAAIFCAKAHGYQMKSRSGGHDIEGLSFTSIIPRFFVLDLLNFRSINVTIDQNEAWAWVQTGATLGEVYYRIAETSNTYGYPAGVCPTVGVGGHISGGGYGNLMRKYGLTIDNVLDAQIIDVKGRLLDRKTMGEDLFWAITGGGAVSFGVVLSYKIKLVPVPPRLTVFMVSRLYDENLADLVHKYQHVAAYEFPEELFLRLTLGVVNNTIRANFTAMYLGSSEQLISVMNESLPELGLQLTDCVETRWIDAVVFWADFPLGTPPADALLNRALQVPTHLKIKSDYVKMPMPEEGLEFIFNKMVELQTPTMDFYPYGGRMAEISPSEKPFPHRAGNIAMIQHRVAWDEDGVEAANRYIELSRKLYEYMTPFVSMNPRENFLNYRDLDIGINHNGRNSYKEGLVYGLRYFKNNFNRLVKVKTKVDPDNFFRNEQSIPVLPRGNIK